MSGQLDDRLRSYYREIQQDLPIRLEANVARAMAAAPAATRVGRWRPIAGLGAVAAAVLLFAFVARGLLPVAAPSTSGSPMPVFGSSELPTDGAVEPTPTTVPTEPPPTATPASTLLAQPTPTPAPTGRPVGSLNVTGSMNPALGLPVAVRLADGRALISGGRENRPTGLITLRSQAAEIYDANTGTFTPTGSMAYPRAGHTATLLRDGRVLIVGGIDASDGIDNLATAELYDPATGQFGPTGSLAQGRAHHTATILGDGRVLIAGGYGGGTLSLKSAEIYDPATGKFSGTGSMTVARRDATAMSLANGLVLIAGGLDLNATSALSAAELYDPTTGVFAATGSMVAARTGFAAMELEDGRVLVAGGSNSAGSPLNSAEFYDPGTGRFSAAGSMTAAGAKIAVWLKDARVLFVASNGLAVYDPASGTFSPVPAPARSVDTATFALGNVLLTEGGPAQVYEP